MRGPTTTDPRGVALTGRRAGSLLLVGFALVLGLFVAVLVGGAITSDRAVEDVRRSGDLARAYLRAQDAFSREDEVEDAAGEDPGELLRAGGAPGTSAARRGRARAARAARAERRRLERRFAAAAGELDAALRTLERRGGPRDRALARRALPLHGEYAAAMRLFFAAMDRGDRAAAAAVMEERADPAQDALQPLITGTGPAYAVAQLRQIDDLRRTNGRLWTVAFVAAPIGVLLFALLVLTFLAFRRRLDAAARAELGMLDAAAHTDTLTGLGNRRALERDLAAGEQGPRTIALVDVVGLKAVNDLDGHIAGDALLRTVAGTLADAVGDQGRCYRLAGDEFAVVVPGDRSVRTLALLESARQRLADDRAGDVRAGVADGDGEDAPGDVMRRADTALTVASRLQRSLVAYGPDLEEVATARPDDGGGLQALTMALARAVDAKDTYTRSHCETVSTLAALIGRRVGVEGRWLAQVRLAGLLHDVGKIGIPDSILNKPGELDAAEWEVMRSHSRLGHDILSAAGLEEEARWVLHHHERMDGAGYPSGLAGEEVPLESRILMVADTFEAITSDRTYRNAAAEADAIAELRRHAGTQFDPDCVAALEAVLSERLAADRARVTAAS